MTRTRAILVSITLSLVGCGGRGSGLLHGDGAAGTGDGGATTGGAGTGAGGTAGGGAAGTGSSGTAGAGGADAAGGAAGTTAGDPTISFEASRQPTDCSVALTAPVAPVVVDAALSCDGAFYRPGLAWGAGERVHVVLNDSVGLPGAAHLFSIDGPNGPTAIEAPAGVLTYARVLTNAQGVPHLVGVRDLSGTSGGSHDFLRPMSPGWLRETIPPDFSKQIWIQDAIFTPDDRAVVVHVAPDGRSAVVATSSAPGVWTSEVVPDGTLNGRAVVDSLGRVHFVHLAPSKTDPGVTELRDWRPGAPVTALPIAGDASLGSIDAVAVEAGRVAISFNATAAVVVATPDGTGTLTVRAVPETQRLSSLQAGCPAPGVGTKTVPATPCSDKRRGTTGQQALAATSDGNLWLAYIDARIDRDGSYSCFPFEQNAPITCTTTVTADRSVFELVVARVPSNGAPFTAASPRWRVRIDDVFQPEVTMLARGTKLALAFPSKVVVNLLKGARMVVLDTTKL